MDRTGGVILDYEIPLTGEIPPALFDGIYLPVFRGAIAFWKKASRELSFIAE